MSDNPGRPRRWLLLLILVLVLLCPCLALIPLGIDGDLPEDADLLATVPDLPIKDNGFIELARLAENDFQQPPQAAQDAIELWEAPGPFPKAALAPYLAANDAAFDQAAALVRDKALQSPLTDGESHPGVLALQNLGRWLGYRARLRAVEGRKAEALGDALTVIRLGLRFEGSARSFADWLTGIICQATGASALADVLAYSELDDPELARLEASLAELLARRDPRVLARCLRDEYRLYVQSHYGDWQSLGELIQPPASRDAFGWTGTWMERFIYKPARTRGLFAEQIRRQVRFLEEGADYEPLEELSGFEEWLSGNLSGRCFVRIATDQDLLENFLGQQDYPRVAIEALRVIVALRRFELAKGRLPQSLAELCPRYLKSLPLDQDGQPLRYRPTLELLYSVGADGEDNTAPGQAPEPSEDPVYSFKRAKKP